MGRTKICSAPGYMTSSGQREMKIFNFPRDSARALVWAGRVGISCTIDSARMLYSKYLCSTHFSDSNFNTAERVSLNRIAVPCGTDSAAQPPEPSIHTPSLDPLPSVVTPEDLHVLTPTKTYSKTLLPYAVTPVPMHADSPSTSFQMSAVQPSLTAASTFAVKETSFLLSSENINASDGELRHINCQSSSSKPRARHSLLKELNLTLLPELTPRKRKLYERIRNKESALCKLKKKYKGMKLKKLCDVDSDPLMENLSSSFSVEAARFLPAIFRNSRQRPKGRRWNFDEKVLALSLHIVQNPVSFSVHYSPSHADNPCKLSCILFHLGQASMPMCFAHSNRLCRKCLIEIDIVPLQY